MKGFLSEERPIRTLREVLQRLRESYCGKIGYEVSPGKPAVHVEVACFLPISFTDEQMSILQGLSTAMCLQYMHIPDRERCNWLRERIETPEEVRASCISLQLELCWISHPCHPTIREPSFCCACLVTDCLSVTQFHALPHALQLFMAELHTMVLHAPQALGLRHRDTDWGLHTFTCATQFSYTPDRKIHILDRLAWSEMFESFLANKFAAAKRFGLEGCETLIPGMKALIDRSTDMGVDSIVMGMPHRGNPLPRYVRCAGQPSRVL